MHRVTLTFLDFRHLLLSIGNINQGIRNDQNTRLNLCKYAQNEKYNMLHQ